MSFYCEKHIKKGRKIKSCVKCKKQIYSEPHWSIPDMCNDYATFTLCEECYEELSRQGIENVDDLYKYDI